MTIDLPFEIWIRIANYLPQDCVKKLYSINHAMFEIAMEAKYRDVRLRSPKDVSKALAVLASPLALRHVHSLGLSPHILHEAVSLQNSTEKIDGFFTRARVLWNPKRISSEDNLALQQEMLRFFRGLATVKSLELESRGHSNCRELLLSLPLMMPALVSFTELRTLSLDIMMEGYQYVPTSTVFPLLETLRIVLSHAYCSTDHKTLVNNVLPPFINNHHATLRTLHLSSLRSSYTFDIPSLLRKLRHFAHLTTFGLWHPFVSIRQSDSAGLSHFLRLHAEHLLHLILHSKGPIQYSMYPTSQEWYAQAFLKVQLPVLQTLDLDIELYPEVMLTASYLGQYRRSLTTLRLSVETLSYENVKEIVQSFSEQDRLLELRMSIAVLSLELLSLLALNLPSLDILHLEFNEFDYSRRNDVILESQHAELDKWNLRHLTVEPSNDAFNGHSDCSAMIQAAMPRLEKLVVIQRSRNT